MQLSQLPKVASQDFFPTFTPAPNPIKRSVYSPTQNRVWRVAHLECLGVVPRLFTNLKQENGRHKHVKLCWSKWSACYKQTKNILWGNLFEVLLSPSSMSSLAWRDSSWEIRALGELSGTQCIVYKYRGRVMPGVVRARESGVLKASFSSGYGGT